MSVRRGLCRFFGACAFSGAAAILFCASGCTQGEGEQDALRTDSIPEASLFAKASKVAQDASKTLSATSKIEGVWLMRDKDNNDEPESVIVLYFREEVAYMKMVAIYHNSKIDDTIEKPLERAKGIDGNPPLCGLDFVWGLAKNESSDRHSGRVINPDNGNVYKCEVWFDEKLSKLVLRGELLIFGENEYLTKFDIDELPFKLDISKLSPNPPKKN